MQYKHFKNFILGMQPVKLLGQILRIYFKDSITLDSKTYILILLDKARFPVPVSNPGPV